jgi:hypothetical protein
MTHDNLLSAVDWASEMSRLRDIKPRPIAKLFGTKGPTAEQAIRHANAINLWNAQYRRASKEQKLALARDNAKFYQQAMQAAAREG